MYAHYLGQVCEMSIVASKKICGISFRADGTIHWQLEIIMPYAFLDLKRSYMTIHATTHLPKHGLDEVIDRVFAFWEKD